jgi:hypothetical protein
MTTEQEQNLLNRVSDLEKLVDGLIKRTIQISMAPIEKENIKNALFENFIVKSDGTETAKTDQSYLKCVWKNKIFYIPYNV